MYENEIVKINEIKGDRILLGYIVGGISTHRKSIFFSNSGVESEASNLVFKVWLTRTGQTKLSDTKMGKK
ncbi:MAG: hypothetical protein IPG67_17090 [Acidobacteria bacterium]|nr:hypothetical protein [Acidobacteriota bacterium]